MWAHTTFSTLMHIWKHNDGRLISLCGQAGEYPLSYTEVKLPKCEKCSALLPKYKEKRNITKEDLC